MEVLSSRAALRRYVASLKKKGKSIGFVPTMGYLHGGHLSLVRRSVRENGATIASIFVNPLQFGPKEDFKSYPRAAARDKKMLRSAGCGALFMPSAAEMYPEGFQTTVAVSELAKPLCGKSRPTHFAGVTTVVSKLLNLVSPDRLYLGQKDFQQCRVLERMIEDLALPVEVRRVPIAREKDGLAMSSRNARLTLEERRRAPALYRALLEARDLIAAGERNASKVKKGLRRALSLAGRGKTDYAEIVDSRTLKDVVKLKPNAEVLVAVAVFFSAARLIDNVVVRVP